MKKILTFICVGMLFCSCNMHQSLTTTVNSNQTDVVLSQANYRIVKTVTGEAKGANARKLVINSAYADLIKNAELTGSQALIYVNIERIKRLVSNRTHVVMSATVIEFID